MRSGLSLGEVRSVPIDNPERIQFDALHVGTTRAEGAVLLCLMLALTLISQFGIIPRMDVLRASLGEVRSVPIDNPERIQFDALHVWSTRVEGAVLLLGLAVVYLTARSF